MMTETVVTVQEVPPNNNATKQTHSPDQPLSWVKINLEYFKTVPGLIKIIEFILGIVCMALAAPAALSETEYFLFAVATSFACTTIWIFLYLLGVREGFSSNIDWLRTELFNTGILALLYLIAFIVQFTGWSQYPSTIRIGIFTVTTRKNHNIAAGAIAIFNFLAYAFGTFLLFRDHKRGQNRT